MAKTTPRARRLLRQWKRAELKLHGNRGAAPKGEAWLKLAQRMNQIADDLDCEDGGAALAFDHCVTTVPTGFND